MAAAQHNVGHLKFLLTEQVNSRAFILHYLAGSLKRVRQGTIG